MVDFLTAYFELFQIGSNFTYRQNLHTKLQQMLKKVVIPSRFVYSKGSSSKEKRDPSLLVFFCTDISWGVILDNENRLVNELLSSE
jgi:hypothetical protein